MASSSLEGSSWNSLFTSSQVNTQKPNWLTTPRKTETARANFTMKAAKNDVAAIWLKP